MEVPIHRHHLSLWWGPAAALVVAVVLPLAVFLTGTWLAGRHLHLVQTGSMEPTYPVGSMLVVSAIDPADVNVGTPVMFEDPDHAGRLITHRVIEVINQDSGLFFRTQGDANASPDLQPVPARSVRGSVAWHVPTLGRAMDWVRWPRGFVLLVVLPAAVLLFGEVRNRRTRPPATAPPSQATGDAVASTADATVGATAS